MRTLTAASNDLEGAFGLTPLGVTSCPYRYVERFLGFVTRSIDMLLSGDVDRFTAETLVQLEMRRAVAEAHLSGRRYDWKAVTDHARSGAEKALYW